ncbi:uncharacterized protein EI97DRAFT_379747 [Westerdykella ornata]|uniref:Tcp11-domain-containing protein n=1 Tax=Westerdykella ornata TaxID=318751 RepID=A0A6A6JFV5_WESOR|nr:uncharacterized protein EI97DRAFT_379747 [Westerdykella ornata]KAF2275155.1 hypothetical protein EI97DRAFT_379747 [Westerdykella ornata]
MPHQAPGSSASLRSADHKFGSLTPTPVDVDRTSCIAETPEPSYRKTKSQQDSQPQLHSCAKDKRRREQDNHVFGQGFKSPSESLLQSIPEQLAELIATVVGGLEGEELGSAFRDAADFPPITKQSLSELDLDKIIANIKLRHDINFDRDLSFRPNLDGPRGEKKRRQASMYWKALIAELRLYVCIFECGPTLLTKEPEMHFKIVQNAKRRIPKMFQTIQEVLKGLVPARDHPGIEEHLDVEKLMQEIERGVCDLVRLAEWLALLLKEHCAPMRDELVDRMVKATEVGVARNSSEHIIGGLRDLFGILEAMKLDVANHQVRNLKTMLIEDTIHFERHYHLERIVHGQARVNVEAAHRWYRSQFRGSQDLPIPAQKGTLRFPFEVFLRAMASSLVPGNSYADLPETFYLDYDRLRTIRLELTDLIHFEMCFDLFSQLLQELGFQGHIPVSTRHQLRASLWAIITETSDFGPFQWFSPNSEHIAIELVRQAAELTRSPHLYNHELIDHTNHGLQAFFLSHYESRAQTILMSHLLPKILDTVSHHMHSSPIELFNNLTASPGPPIAPALSTLAAAPPPHSVEVEVDDMLATALLSPTAPDQIADIAKRVAHVALLHWRIWGPIAYVLEEETHKDGRDGDVHMQG